MSFQVMTWARGIKTGSITVKAVLMAVANYADENGVSWPSQEQLAEDVEASRHTVLRALDVLAERGMLKRERRHRSDGSRTSDRIILNLSYVASNVAHSNVAGSNVATDPEPMLQAATAEPVIESPLKEKGKARVRPSPKGSRLAENWMPNFDAVEFSATDGARHGKPVLTAGEIERELARFRDYWSSQPGQKGVKTDWQGTFRNWLRKAADDKQQRKSAYAPRAGAADKMADAFSGLRAKAAGASDTGPGDFPGGSPLRLIPGSRGS